MQPSICALITSGFTATPQSTAQKTRSTLTLPSLSVTSATWATVVPKHSCTAMPCAEPAGMALPQPDLSATSLSTPTARGLRELVHHRLHHVRGVRVAHRAPPQGAHGQGGGVQLALHHRQLVGRR